MTTRRFEGKVVFITGAARGQGREHAIRFASEGADIVAVDIARSIDSVDGALASSDDLQETARLVEATGGRIIVAAADVRDQAALDAAARRAIDEFGRIDIVLANAAIESFGAALELDEQKWADVIDINLGGAWRTVKAAAPYIVEGGRGGAIVMTGSYCGIRGTPNGVHYVASKHGLVGMMKTLTNELGQHGIRVNVVHPGLVWTPMVDNPRFFREMRPDLENPTKDDVIPVVTTLNPMNIPWVEACDISNAMLFLASDDARYITGVEIAVDGGFAQKT